ncbi:hypothetical protein KR038_010687, partial [Drosophila bunnanda]
MVTALTNQGMTDIDTVQLARKFRNLKNTFFCIRSKHLGSGAQNQPKLVFYDQMSEIIKNEAQPRTQVAPRYDNNDHSNPVVTIILDDYDEADSKISILGGTHEAVVSPAEVRPNRKRNTMVDRQQQPKISKNNIMRGEPTEMDCIEVCNAAKSEDSVAETKDELSIGTTEQALKHLRAIREFAMIQENFRAIGRHPGVRH